MFPICGKDLCQPSLIYIHRTRALILLLWQGLISKSMQHNKVDKIIEKK